ncbi:TorF family putative porin [Sphingomonas sp. Leaf339]|uniref:TorF family putative porin n=1 Tax=Sphingomonas sp. Leaf339 TaxID=1736343 RepID=UPI001F35E318|nr:TorF family putative porin [Sphingomonas sp. Leaf339]
MSEEERRGLSWSEGRAAMAGGLRVSLGQFDASARTVTLRKSVRHDGADAVVDILVGTGWNLGAVQLRTNAAGHVFAGALRPMDYVEADVSASYAYGPLYVTIGAIGAPSQRSIGGSNVHFYANANAGIPGTPFTMLAEIGHSSGKVRDAVRAARLRPGGDYSNWRLGLQHRHARLTIGVDYIGTDVSRSDIANRFADQPNSGDRIIGRVQILF